jgi:hypothetical protein
MLRIVFFILAISANAMAQPKGGAVALRDSLAHWSQMIRAAQNDSVAYAAALRMEQHITAAYRGVPQIGEALDSLPYLGQISSDDGAVRLLNWNTLHSDGTMGYHCVVLHRDAKGMVQATVLRDSTDLADENMEGRRLMPDAWYGALYYRVVSARYKKKPYYLLIGWDGKDNLSSRKVVDVLSLVKGRALLGEPIIRVDRRPKHRLIFEYAEDVTMSLNLDERMGMVVMDHLAPKEPYLKGIYQFYGPDMSHDGLVFEQGRWVYVPDVDARNRGVRREKYITP